MRITPWISGSGRSGHAIARSLACLSVDRPELGLAPARFVPRGTELGASITDAENPVLFVSGPHGLHAKRLLEAEKIGLRHAVSEKPACVTPDEAKALRAVNPEIAILHVYRMMWGPKELERMLKAGELGELITIEGRYWQASTAERALTAGGTSSWKNDVALGGAYDTYLDVASHWVDMVTHFMGALPERIGGWMSYRNAEAAHRDSHVQLTLDYPQGGRAFGSISKTVHGATNHFEINLLGTKGAATWTFLRPDEIVVGRGRDHSVVTRKTSEEGSRQPPFHAMGWLEGYIAIAEAALGSWFLGEKACYPTLGRHLELLEKMFSAELVRAR